MNQAQFVGERALRCDPSWSPLAQAFVGFAQDLLTLVAQRDEVVGTARDVLAALPASGRPVGYGEVYAGCPHLGKSTVHDQLHVLMRQRRVLRTGRRGDYRYAVPIKGE